MAVSVQSLLTERKYPFIFTFSLLLIFVTFFLVNNSQSPLSIISVNDLIKSTPPAPINSTPPPINSAPPIDTTPPVLNDTVPRVDNNQTAVIVNNNENENENEIDNDNEKKNKVEFDTGSLMIEWRLCTGPGAVDYIPCLDNWEAIKKLKSRTRMEHRERYCPASNPRCLEPLPDGYKDPVPWPKSRDMIWYNNVPHPKLVVYKKEQNWVAKKDDYFIFPGGGTQFRYGVNSYIDSLAKTVPTMEFGSHTRVVLDVGCGVASFGGKLLDNNVLTMSLAPKDEHEAQIQFALERGIPATLSVIATHRLAFPDNVYDVVHCARCRVHWQADGGKPLMELNRVLRPGGFFIWSATPVYRKDEAHRKVWREMIALSESFCWKVVNKTSFQASGIGVVVFQKPISPSCYEHRKEKIPPLCEQSSPPNSSWYAPLDECLRPLPSFEWPAPWPKRLVSRPPSLSTEREAEAMFNEDNKHWSPLVSDVYLGGLAIDWSRVRNVMDMKAGYGGFAAALIDRPVWVMNVVPIDGPDTLSIIFDRGLIGVYHDWCESFNTYPRTFDLLHSSYLLGNLTQRCDIIDIAVEMDRILRPSGVLIVQDSMEMINKLSPVLRSLHWTVNLHEQQFLVGKKGFWRP